jgi:hypothetical protein
LPIDHPHLTSEDPDTYRNSGIRFWQHPEIQQVGRSISRARYLESLGTLGGKINQERAVK